MGAGGDPAVAFIGGGAGDRHLAPRQRIEYVEQGAAVLLHREHELAAMLMDMVRGGRHCMQRIGGHDLVVQVDLAEHHRGHRHLIGFHADLGLRGDHRGSGVRAGQGASRRTWFPPASLEALTALPSSLTCINARERSSAPAVAAVVNPARSISHVPTAASNASVPASVSTRQMAVFDGGGAGTAPLRRYTSAGIAGGTSATQQTRWWEALRANWAESTLALFGFADIAAALTKANQLSGRLLAALLLFPRSAWPPRSSTAGRPPGRAARLAA